MSEPESDQNNRVEFRKTAVGTRLWDYDILKEIGRGAMGVVYQARQVTANRVVALKILPNRLAQRREYRHRFLREARSAGRLTHPHIVAVHDVAKVKGVYFIVMEYVEGISAREKLRKEGVFNEPELVRLVREMASALVAAHGQGIVHRDVKPENILIQHDGAYKLADLGLAFVENADSLGVRFDAEGKELTPKQEAEALKKGVTVHGKTLGTPHYMSPEQIRGGKIDGRTDLYSLGASLFTLATGQPPFTGKTHREVFRKVLGDPFPNLRGLAPQLSAGFVAVIEKLMQKNPAERYAHGQALLASLDALDRGARDKGATTSRIVRLQSLGGGRRGRRPIRTVKAGRGSAGIPAMVFLGLILVAVGIVGFTFLGSSSRQPERSEDSLPGSAAEVPLVSPEPGEALKKEEAISEKQEKKKSPKEQKRKAAGTNQATVKPHEPNLKRPAIVDPLLLDAKVHEDSIQKAVKSGDFVEADRYLENLKDRLGGEHPLIKHLAQMLNSQKQKSLHQVLNPSP